MSKKKQKTSKAKHAPSPFAWSPARVRRLLKNRPLLAGLVVAFVGVSIGLLAVSAQSDGLSTKPTEAKDSDVSAGQNTSDNGSSEAANKAKSSEDAKAKAAEEAKKKAAAASSAGANGSGSASAPAPQPAPTPPPVQPPSGWHHNITATVFWVGEAAGPDNAGISNAQSAWDGNWEAHYGGYDDPDNRNGYYPAGFTPLENPFYFALPYNDLDENGNRKSTASNCPNIGGNISWCKNAWIKIMKGSSAAYAQWQDVGPMNEDDVAYVFGGAAPANTWGAKAGLDVSPAVRDYLGLTGVDVVSWTFVPASEVPAGPWKQIVTTSQGGW